MVAVVVFLRVHQPDNEIPHFEARLVGVLCFLEDVGYLSIWEIRSAS